MQADRWATFHRDYGRNLDAVQARLEQWEDVMINMKATGKQPSQAMRQQQQAMMAYAAHSLEGSGGQRQVGIPGCSGCQLRVVCRPAETVCQGVFWFLVSSS